MIYIGIAIWQIFFGLSGTENIMASDDDQFILADDGTYLEVL